MYERGGLEDSEDLVLVDEEQVREEDPGMEKDDDAAVVHGGGGCGCGGGGGGGEVEEEHEEEEEEEDMSLPELNNWLFIPVDEAKEEEEGEETGYDDCDDPLVSTKSLQLAFMMAGCSGFNNT